MEKNEIIKKVWDDSFDKNAKSYISNCNNSAEDFIYLIKNTEFEKEMIECKNVLEIGCGTGELSKNLSVLMTGSCFVATDISQSAINYASKYSNERLSYKTLDFVNEEISDEFDMCICSNTLEHFEDPFEIVDKVLSKINTFVIIVPFMQIHLDLPGSDGGVGHRFTFNEKTFTSKGYNCINMLIYRSRGWSFFREGENAKLIAYMIKK